MIPCPDCDSGKHVALIKMAGQRECELVEIDCSTCSGTAVVSEAAQSRRVAGRALRDARVAAGLSLHEASASAPGELRDPFAFSQAERGQRVYPAVAVSALERQFGLPHGALRDLAS